MHFLNDWAAFTHTSNEESIGHSWIAALPTVVDRYALIGPATRNRKLARNLDYRRYLADSNRYNLDLRAMTSRQDIAVPKRHDKVGQWILKRELGRGGNGQVWLAENEAGGQSAVKLLMKLRPIPYARFKDEVVALRRAAGVQGILPVLDADLPDDISTRRPWYAMPVGTPLLQFAPKLSVQRKVQAIL